MSAFKNRTDNVEKLSGANFNRWKLQISLILEAADLWDVVNGTEVIPATDDAKIAAWKKKDVQARSLMVTTLDAGQTSHIYKCKTAKEIFDTLSNANSDSSSLNKQHTMSQFLNYRIKSDQSPVEAMMEIEELVRCLTEMKVTMDEATVITKIVSSLPDSYNSFKTAWDSVPEATQTREMLMMRLKKEDLRKKQDSAPTSVESEVTRAFYTSSEKFRNPDRKSKEGGKLNKKNIKCFQCGKMGHFKRECRSGKPKDGQESKGRGASGQNDAKRNSSQQGGESWKNDSRKDDSEVRTAFMGKFVEGSTFKKDDWISDSGATQHICGDKSWFRDYEPFLSDRMVMLSNNLPTKVLGKGTVELEAQIQGEWMRCTLDNVLHIPGGANLFSEGILALKGFKIQRDDKMTIFWDDSGYGGPSADYVNGLYIMRFRPIQVMAGAAAVRGDLSRLWHQRLTHINPKYVMETVQQAVVKGIPLKDVTHPFDCGECQMGKQARKPFPRTTTETNYKPGEKLHADLAGKMPVPSLGGAKYFLLMKDDATGFRCVNFLRSKDETTKCLKDFILKLETQTGNKMKIVYTDNGGEFINKEFAEFCREKGIIHETSVPYCPESNGRIEREMRTIKDCARTILISSELPEPFWAEAVATTVYVHNRVLDKQSQGKTAFEAIFRKVPSLGHLRVFGCTAFAHVPDARRTVWEPKGKKCKLVGYSSLSRKYRLYDEESKIVFEARNVTFHEEHPQVATFERGTSPVAATDPQEVEEIPKPTSPQILAVDREDTGVSTDSDDEDWSQSPWASKEESSKGNDDSSPAASTSTSQVRSTAPKTREVIVKTRNGQFVAEIPEGADEAEIIIPKQKKKTKKFKDFVPQVLDSRLRKREDSLPPPHHPQFHAAKGVEEPETYKEAISSPQRTEWIAAMAEEIASQEANKTWAVVTRPDGIKLLDTRWIFKIKRNSDGSIARHKARLVIRGYRQQEGIDYNETFASVCRYESIRLLLNIAAAKKLHMAQFDVKTAFLHGDLEEEIYTKLPEGFEVGGKNQVLKLIKSIYGLKQAPRCWSEKFSGFLHEFFGLQRSAFDPSVYFGWVESVPVFLALYVDDGLVITPKTQTIEIVLSRIAAEFAITRGPPTSYVGLEIIRSESGAITICQRQYIQTLLTRFNLEECNSSSVPLQPYTELVPAKVSQEDFPYRQLIGALLFLAKCSRPDVAFAVSRLSQFVTCFDESHWKAAKGILRYLKGTSEMGIRYESGGDLGLEGFSDADYAGDKLQRRSTSGVAVMLNGAIISWSSQKQTCVALSSTEAEYVAAASGTREIVWIRNFLKELGFPQPGPTSLWVDNQSAIKLVKNPEMHSRTKHIDVRYHYIRDQVNNNEIRVEYVPTSDQLADGLTKPLMKGKLEDNRQRLGVNSWNIPSILWTILTLLSLQAGGFAQTSRQTTPVLWRKSEQPVTIGHYQVNLLVQFVNPCDILTNATIHSQLTDAAKTQCESVYSELFLDEMELMCPRKNWTELTLRSKRFINLLVGLFVIGCLISAGLAFSGTTVASVAAHKARTLESSWEDASELMANMEKRLRNHEQYIQQLQTSFNTAMDKMGNLQDDHDELKGKMVSTSYAISYIMSRLMVGKSVIREAARQWKNGKVSPAFLDYFNLTIPCGDTCPIEYARATRCAMSEDRKKLYLDFQAPLVSSDLTLVNADPFQLMMRKEDRTCTVKYTGPANVILSRNESCVYAMNLGQPARSDLILSPTRGCRTLPRTNETKYFSLSHCEARQEKDEQNFIQIKPQNNYYHIYCPESKFSLDGTPMDCPNEVFTVPIKANFKINDLEFDGTRISMVHQEALDHIFSMKANMHLQPSINWTSLKTDLNMTEPENIPINHVVVNYWTTGAGGFIIMLLIVVIIVFLVQRKKETNIIRVKAMPTQDVE